MANIGNGTKFRYILSQLKFQNMKKIVFLGIFAFIFLLGAGCLPEPEPADEISKLLLNLEKNTKIDFSEIIDIEFNWNLQTEEGVQGSAVLGKRFEAIDISMDEIKKIEEFFENKIFFEDVHNIAAGAAVNLKGYKKDNIVCVVRSGASGGVDTPNNEVREDAIVSCGEVLESNKNVSLPNPASVYCKNRGGKEMNIATVAGISTYCILPEGDICEEWKYFYSAREECIAPETEFESVEDCESACEEIGKIGGECKIFNSFEEGEINLGGCWVRSMSSLCGLEGKCFCACQ